MYSYCFDKYLLLYRLQIVDSICILYTALSRLTSGGCLAVHHCGHYIENERENDCHCSLTSVHSSLSLPLSLLNTHTLMAGIRF